MQEGRLIVFEGMSGTGKETQAKLLQKYLSGKKITSEIIYHPTPELKQILTDWRKKRAIDAASEVYFLLADRSDRIRQVVVPGLGQGYWIISLRNMLSTLVYQGETQADHEWIKEEYSRFEPAPDLLVWFDIEPAKALTRIMKRHRETGEPVGKFETMEYLTDKRKKYKTIMNAYPHLTIDASETIDQIHRLIRSKIETFF